VSSLEDCKRDIALIKLFGEPLERGRNKAYLEMDDETLELAIAAQIAKDEEEEN
jgi:hypothetical protein